MTTSQLLVGMMYASIFVAPCAFLLGVAAGNGAVWKIAISLGKARHNPTTGKREFI